MNNMIYIYKKKTSEDNKSIYISVFLLERIKLVMFITSKWLVSLYFAWSGLLLYALCDISITGNIKEARLPLQPCNFKYAECSYNNKTKSMLLPLISQDKIYFLSHFFLKLSSFHMSIYGP